jgi:riboflavin kinase/FMN adenylyltransferase
LKHCKDLFNTKELGLYQGSYVTIGSFDGVHKGHQQLITRVVEESRRSGKTSIVVTFDPLPKQFFGKGNPMPLRLTDSLARAERIAALGVDILLEYTFDNEFSMIAADEFIDLVLLGLRPEKIVVGKDFRFGRDCSGDAATLMRRGFETEVIHFIHNGDQRISSTGIRRAIAEGQLLLASRLMGSRHQMRGRIIQGIKRSDLLLIPSMEIVMPPLGSYRVYIQSRNKRIAATAIISGSDLPIELKVERHVVKPFLKGDVLVEFVQDLVMADAVH